MQSLRILLYLPLLNRTGKPSMPCPYLEDTTLHMSCLQHQPPDSRFCRPPQALWW